MIHKTGEIKVNKLSTNGLLEDMEQKYFSGAQWAKVFEHNNHAGTVLFTSIAEVKHSETSDKYSRLYLLDSITDKGGKYEFLLEYPDDLAGSYNRWKQTNNPLNEFVAETSAGDGKCAGYEAVHTDWTGNYWGGIARQKSDPAVINSTYLDGSVGHGNWWYAIGAVSNFSGGVPGPSAKITGRVQLWVRIDNLVDEDKVKLSSLKCLTAKDFNEI